MSSIIGSLCETRDDILNVEWKIESFLSLPAPDVAYTSPTFQFSDSSWNLAVHPYGRSGEENLDSVAFYLRKMERNSKETVAFEVGVKQANGGVCLQLSRVCMLDNTRAYGWGTFCTRSELLQEKTDLLPSDALTISCTLRKFPSHRGLNTLSSDFESMLASAKYSDVTIRVETMEYKAHRSVLAARSSVFSAMFDHDTAEKNSGEVNIADCEPESFKEFLGFLYTGRADVTEHNVCDIYKTADKYCVEELKMQCVLFMLQNLSVDNVCEVAAFGDLFSDSDLNCHCKAFFERNIRDILQSSKWGQFMEDNNRVAGKLLKSVAPRISIECKRRRLDK